MKKFTNDWFNGNVYKFQHLFNKYLNKTENINFLEIGSFEGNSSCWFFENYIQNKSSSTMTCIDTWEGSMEHSDEQKSSIWETFQDNTKEYDREKFIIKRGFSKDILKTLKNKSYDFIYVDGSHIAKDVLCDAILSFDLLKCGGIMTFDDYLWNPYNNSLLSPKIAIDSFINNYLNEINIVELSDQVTILKK